MAVIKYNYFTTDYAIKEHDFIIARSGGLMGVKDRGMIDSVLHHIKNDDYYPEFLDKITHLVFGLSKNHAFNDGNKRTSIALSSFFLELNDHDFAVRQYTHGMEEVVIWVVRNLVSKNILRQIIEFLLYADSLNIAYFIDQAKQYRPFIEPQDAPIDATLLTRMVNEWLSGDMSLSDDTLLALLDVLPSLDDAEEGEGPHDNLRMYLCNAIWKFFGHRRQ